MAAYLVANLELHALLHFASIGLQLIRSEEFGYSANRDQGLDDVRHDLAELRPRTWMNRNEAKA